MSEVNKYPSEVGIVLVDAVVELLNVLLIEEAEDMLLELPAPLPWDNLDQGDFLFDSFLDDAVEFGLDCLSLVEDVVEV